MHAVGDINQYLAVKLRSVVMAKISGKQMLPEINHIIDNEVLLYIPIRLRHSLL